MRRLQRLPLALLASSLAIYPPLLAYLMSGLRAPFAFFAGDAFYYLAVAKNSNAKTLFSFDTLHSTNGFHPLWQYFLRSCVIAIGPLRTNESAQILFVYAVSTAFVGIAAAFLYLAFRRMTGSLLLSLFAVVPGFFYWFFSFADRNYGSLWSFANGMESPFSLFFFSLFLFLLARRPSQVLSPAKFAFLLSIVLSLIVLSRLDDVFLIPAAALMVFVHPRRPSRWRDTLLLCALPCVSVASYCAFNKYYAGTYLPISGATKNGFALRGNVGYLLNTFYPIYPLKQGNWQHWDEGTWRELQMIVPMFAASIAVALQLARAYRRSKIPGPRGRLIAALSIYVLLKGGYNFFFVALYAQGHWYFPLSISIFNLLTVVTLGDVIRRAFGRRPAAPRRWARLVFRPALFVLALAMIVFIGNSLLAEKDVAGPGSGYTFWMKREAINAQIPSYYNGTGILEFEDGLISYASDKPTMSGIGFALDLEAAKAKQSGKLLQLAYDRGFRLIGTIYYGCPMPTEPGTNVNSYLAGHVYWLTPQDLKDWQFILRYHDTESGLELLEFKPR